MSEIQIETIEELFADDQPRFRFYTLAQLRQRPPQRFLIDEILIVNAFSSLWGQPASYKSVLALDWSLCVASGQDWHGYGVERGPVVYIASEGDAGLAKRAQAWESMHPGADTSAFYVLPDTVRALVPNDADAFLRELPCDPALVIIDTLSRSLAGGNENAPDDMGRFVDFCERIRRETGATPLVIHHSDKAGNHSRGHSSFLGAVQTEIEAKLADGYVTLKCTKQKDHEAFAPIGLRPRIVNLDDEGAETSVVLLPGGLNVAALNDTAKVVLGVLEPKMTVALWLPAAIRAGVARRTFFRHKSALIKNGFVRQDGETYSLVPQCQAGAKECQVTGSVVSAKVPSLFRDGTVALAEAQREPDPNGDLSSQALCGVCTRVLGNPEDRARGVHPECVEVQVRS